MKKIKKIIVTFVCISICMTIGCLNISMAVKKTDIVVNAGVTSGNMIDVRDNLDEYDGLPDGNTGELVKKGNIVIGIIQAIGAVVSVVALILIGFKYMMGSVEEKAEYKKTMIPYIIGAIMLGSIVTIVGIIAGTRLL